MRRVGGELRTYAHNGRRKVVSEADVTSYVTVLTNHERIVRLVALFTSPRFHARDKAHVYHVVHCIMAVDRLVDRAPGLNGWV